MPKWDETKANKFQYTGQGWQPVDSEAEQRKLRELQIALAVRLAEIEADGGDE